MKCHINHHKIWKGFVKVLDIGGRGRDLKRRWSITFFHLKFKLQWEISFWFEFTPWVVFIHWVLSCYGKAADRYDIKMTSMMMMMMMKVEMKVVMTMTPWKKDDDHDEGVEGLLTDHPVNHFPHTRKNQIIVIFDIVSDQTKLVMYISKTEKQGKLCRKQSVCRISLTQEIMTIHYVDFNWSIKRRWGGCPTVRYEIHMLGGRV